MGLKDQAIAFTWIQDNIESFGGDKNRITIYGHSSGKLTNFTDSYIINYNVFFKN